MSNLSQLNDNECDSAQCESGVELLLIPRKKDLGGFSVRRVLPTARRKMVGPWVFFDHMGPASFPAGDGINVRPHPHIGLATVTYLFEGEILHRDSLGSLQPIRPGDLNLMVAGRGIVHSERERPEITSEPHHLHGLQLWHALPIDDEECEPAFYHHPAASLPETRLDDVPVRVLMGTAYGLTSPVLTFCETLYVEAWLKTGDRLPTPLSQERAVYIASGAARVGKTELPEHSMAILQPDYDGVIEATAETRLAIIGGEPLGQRFIDWNFVSSRRERIEAAKADWREGRYERVPGDEQEFIPLP